MTSAEFETYIREIPRIKSLAALQLADVIMLPHVSQSARSDWFRTLTKTLLPRFASSNVISFNGKQIGFKELKKQFTNITRKVKAQPAVDKVS